MAQTSLVCFGCCSSYTLGLFFILLVSIIWSAASVLVQFLYTKQSFDSPFLLTYIGVSLFTLLLPTKVAIEQGKILGRYIFGGRDGGGTGTGGSHGAFAARSESNELLEITGASDMGQYENVPSVESGTAREGEEADDNDNDVAGDNQFRDEDQREEQGINDDAEETRPTDIEIIRDQAPWTNSDHMWAALKIAPIWFLANWTYNASLAYTSITSSTVLASTGSLFTFIFAICYKDEQFTCLKFLGVLFGVMGSLFTALHDASGSDSDPSNSSPTDGEDGLEDSNPLFFRMRLARHLVAGPAYRDGGDIFHDRALFGDALGLVSAIGYGGYAVMVRVLCPRNESLMSMEVLLGYIGLFNMVALSPILFYQLYQGNHSELTWVVFGFLVIKGLLDNVLSDYLWARSVILTSATVATVGLGLTIPLAFLSDVFWTGQEGNQVVSLSSVGGALSVLVGFVLVNISSGEKPDEHEDVHVLDNDADNEEDQEQITEMKEYHDDEGG